MNRHITIMMLILVFMMSACSHTIPVKTNSAQFTQLQKKTLSQKAVVTLKNGQVFENANIFQLTPDSVSRFSQRGKKFRATLQDVTELRFLNKIKGGYEGMGFGLLAGALFSGGLVLWAKSDDDTRSHGDSYIGNFGKPTRKRTSWKMIPGTGFTA